MPKKVTKKPLSERQLENARGAESALGLIVVDLKYYIDNLRGVRHLAEVNKLRGLVCWVDQMYAKLEPELLDAQKRWKSFRKKLGKQ